MSPIFIEMSPIFIEMSQMSTIFIEMPQILTTFIRMNDNGKKMGVFRHLYSFPNLCH